MTEPVRKSIVVRCPPELAFEIFTKDIATWWPLDKNSVSAMSGEKARSVVLEPRVGGAVYEIKADGGREDWARVTAFEPARRLALAWHVMSPPDVATDVDVVFTAEGAGTRVDLTHTGWEVLGVDGPARRDGYNAGWVNVFETCFAEACAAKV